MPAALEWGSWMRLPHYSSAALPHSVGDLHVVPADNGAQTLLFPSPATSRDILAPVPWGGTMVLHPGGIIRQRELHIYGWGVAVLAAISSCWPGGAGTMRKSNVSDFLKPCPVFQTHSTSEVMLFINTRIQKYNATDEWRSKIKH